MIARPPIKKKVTATEILRKFGLPDNYIRQGKHMLRYTNPIVKGIAWFWFSRYTVKRDIQKYGFCISCGHEIEEADCGHFIAASVCGPELLMDERNNNAECAHCNAWDPMHLRGYAKGLDERYGKGTAEGLYERYEQHKKRKEVMKDFNEKYYEEKALYYKKQYELL